MVAMLSSEMAMRTDPFPTDVRVEDHFVILRGATWADYERLQALREESAVPRITYAEGTLQLMTPCWDHESIKSIIGCLVEVWCLEHGVEFDTCGSWTVKNKTLGLGLEADESYVFHGTGSEPARPDLAIEVIWTSGSIDKLAVYAALGVREVWFWQRGVITPYVLDGDVHVAQPRSHELPELDLVELSDFATRPRTSTSAIIRAYRDAVRARG